MTRIIRMLSVCFICFICLQGFTCIKDGGKNAYKVCIDTASIDEASYRSLNLSDILLKRSYKQFRSEKPLPVTSFTGQSGFCSSFTKIITKEPYSVDVYVKYTQLELKSQAKSLQIWIVNRVVGSLDPNVRHEIDEVSEAIYQELVIKTAKEKVSLTKQEGNAPPTPVEKKSSEMYVPK